MNRRKVFNISFGLAIICIVFSSCGKTMVPASSIRTKDSSYDSTAADYIYIEAIKQKLLGNAGDAIKLLEQCIKENPANDAAYYQISQILLESGDVNNGKKYLLRAYELNQNNYWYMIMLSGTYYQEKNLDSAVVFYEKAVKIYPEKEDMQLNLGNLYAENKKYEKAFQVFDNLDKKYGINESSTPSGIKVLIAEGKYAEAEEKTKQLIEKYPDVILYSGLLAEIYSGSKDNVKAMQVYKNLMLKSPDNPETQLSLCNFLMDQKSYDEFITLLNKVILNKDILKEDKIGLFSKMIENPELIVAKGNDIQLASMIMEAIYKDDDIILLLRPEILTARKMMKEAASRLEEIITDRPDNYYAWEKLLFVYLDEKDYKDLQEKGELCATKFNRSFPAKILYASAATENKNYDIALEELRKASILAGDDNDMLMQVLSLKADVYYRMKEYDKSFRTFDEAIKKNPNDVTMLNNYAYYLAEQNTRLKDAETMARKVIEKEKGNTTFLDTYGWVLYKRGKLNEAAKVMESVINSGKEEDAEWYEHYGYILKKKKNCDEAVINWKIAIKIDSSKVNLLKEIENCQGNH
ncbi:MAG: tetratricopeptide repeat protein [Bacteroidales bacterium]